MKTAENLIPLQRRGKHPWWNEDCEQAIKSRHQALRTWNSKKSENTHAAFLTARKEATGLIRQTKRQYEKNKPFEVEEDLQGNHNKNSLKYLKQI